MDATDHKLLIAGLYDRIRQARQSSAQRDGLTSDSAAFHLGMAQRIVAAKMAAVAEPTLTDADLQTIAAFNQQGPLAAAAHLLACVPLIASQVSHARTGEPFELADEDALARHVTERAAALLEDKDFSTLGQGPVASVVTHVFCATGLGLAEYGLAREQRQGGKLVLAARQFALAAAELLACAALLVARVRELPTVA